MAAEALGLALGIADLMRASRGIILYVKIVKNAPQERDKIVGEISCLSKQLAILENRVAESNKGDAWYVAIRRLCTVDGLFDQMKASLDQLEAKLAPADQRMKLFQRLFWKYEKSDIGNEMDKISGYRNTITFALQSDQFALEQAMNAKLDTLGAGQNSTLSGVSDLQLRQQKQDKFELEQCLSKADFWVQQQQIFNVRQPGTGQWLLKRDEFLKWKNGSEH